MRRFIAASGLMIVIVGIAQADKNLALATILSIVGISAIFLCGG